MTAGTFALRRAAVVYVALLCAVEVFALEDPIAIRILQSASTSTTVNKFNCVRPTPVTRLVRFQSFNVSGSQYERVSVADEVISFYFHTGAKNKTFNAPSLDKCLLAVGKAGMDAVQFVDNTCTGYNLSASGVVCRCSSGTNLLFVKSSKFQSSVPTGGYKKTDGNLTITLIYSSLFLSAQNRDTALNGDCLDNKALLISNAQYHDSAGSCLGSYAIIDTSQCTSSCSLTPVLVISPLNPSPNIYFLDSCGGTVTIPLATDLSPPTVIMSHVGYGCSAYPQPAADTECAVTVMGVDASVSEIDMNYFLALSGNGAACQDDLTIYEGTDASGTTLIPTTCTADPDILVVVPPVLHVVFKRRPALGGASPSVGFYFAVFGL